MSEPFRILHIVRQFDPSVGGLESYVKAMAEHQMKLGYKCAVLTLNRIFHKKGPALAPREIIDGISVHRIPFVGTRRFFIPLVKPSFFKKYDIIHVHNTDVFFDYISLVSKIQKKPAFATTHGGFFHTRDLQVIKKIYFKLITKNSCRRYRVLFATSQNDYNTFQKASDSLKLKPNAIAPPGDFIADGQDFVYLGRLAKHKNIPGLLSTFSLLKIRHGVPGKLHIIGPEWDVRKADLTRLSAQLWIEKSVVFHGFVKLEDMQTVLKNCGWFMSASSFEGFGMSMLEAMAVGLIPFVQPNESFRELVSAGGVGACVDFTSPEKAAAKITKRMSKISTKDKLKARAFALQFSWEQLAKDTVTTYREHLTDDSRSRYSYFRRRTRHA